MNPESKPGNVNPRGLTPFATSETSMQSTLANTLLTLIVLIQSGNGDVLKNQIDSKPPFLDTPASGTVKSEGIELSINLIKDRKLIVLTKNGTELSRGEFGRDLELYSVISNKNGFWFILRKNVADGIKAICLGNIDSELGIRFYSIDLPDESRIFSVTGATDEGVTVICSVLVNPDERRIKYVSGIIPCEKLKLLDSVKIEQDPDQPMNNEPRKRIPETVPGIR